MIRAIWPSWDNYTKGGSKNSIPDSTGASTGLFVSFFLFWLGSLPFLWFPVHKLRHLFTVKSYVAPSAGIALFIWAIVRANGLGPIVDRPAAVQGSELAWGIIKGIMSAIANFATLIVNDPDFSRFARRPRMPSGRSSSPSPSPLPSPVSSGSSSPRPRPSSTASPSGLP